MRELPIIFSTAMVAAILENRKTQTRRIVKPQPSDNFIAPEEGLEWRSNEDGICGRQRYMNGDSIEVECIWFPTQVCPYGQPGDVLWVRESFQETNSGGYIYKAPEGRETFSDIIPWKPSIHLPRTAARIFLQVENIRVERLQEITVEDCIKEGIAPETVELKDHKGKVHTSLYQTIVDFQILWNEINGSRASWESNCWVWVIEFTRIADHETKKLSHVRRSKDQNNPGSGIRANRHNIGRDAGWTRPG